MRLGNAQIKPRPSVRLIRATLGGQTLLLTTGEMGWSAEQILAAYKKRGRIEQFHRLVKEGIGLAHLYSFSWNGMMFLLHVARLMAMLLALGKAGAAARETVDALREALKLLRRRLGLVGEWKRNSGNAIVSPFDEANQPTNTFKRMWALTRPTRQALAQLDLANRAIDLQTGGGIDFKIF